MDKADIANDYIEWRTEQALKARQQAGREAVILSRAICMQCDEPIPAARRKAMPGVRRKAMPGVQFCVACQTVLEGQ